MNIEHAFLPCHLIIRKSLEITSTVPLTELDDKAILGLKRERGGA